MSDALSFLAVLFAVAMGLWFFNDILGEPIITVDRLSRLLAWLRPYWRLLLIGSLAGFVTALFLGVLFSRWILGEGAEGMGPLLAIISIPGGGLSALALWQVLNQRGSEIPQAILGLIGGAVYGVVMVLVLPVFMAMAG